MTEPRNRTAAEVADHAGILQEDAQQLAGLIRYAAPVDPKEDLARVADLVERLAAQVEDIAAVDAGVNEPDPVLEADNARYRLDEPEEPEPAHQEPVRWVDVSRLDDGSHVKRVAPWAAASVIAQGTISTYDEVLRERSPLRSTGSGVRSGPGTCTPMTATRCSSPCTSRSTVP